MANPSPARQRNAALHANIQEQRVDRNPPGTPKPASCPTRIRHSGRRTLPAPALLIQITGSPQSGTVRTLDPMVPAPQLLDRGACREQTEVRPHPVLRRQAAGHPCQPSAKALLPARLRRSRPRPDSCHRLQRGRIRRHPHRIPRELAPSLCIQRQPQRQLRHSHILSGTATPQCPDRQGQPRGHHHPDSRPPVCLHRPAFLRIDCP